MEMYSFEFWFWLVVGVTLLIVSPFVERKFDEVEAKREKK